jgi:hypothetical protein
VRRIDIRDFEGVRPNWLTAGAIRLGVLSLFVVLTAMVRPRLRRVGLPLIGLAFFLVWTFVYIGIWWVHPHEAFRGLEQHPLRRLLLHGRLDRVHLAARRHRRPLTRRAGGDGDRDADRVRARDGLCGQLPRAPARERPRAARRRGAASAVADGGEATRTLA